MNPIRLTREQLYEAVWTEPARTLAKRYGVSDVAIGKACRRLKVPRPWVGYWRQRECGKRIRRPRLPQLKPEEQDSLASVTFAPQSAAPGPIAEEPTGPVADQKRFEAEHPITVLKNMGRSHSLVKLTRDQQKQPYYKRRGLDVKVSKESLSRALRIMNALVKALERRGFAVTSSPSEEGPTTLVEVSGTQLGIRLIERNRKVEREPTS